MIAATILVSAVIGSATPALADLVTNGDFEEITNGGGQLGFNTNATDWTSATTSYNFSFTPGSADTTGVTGQYGNLQLWGPNNGSANGLPATSQTAAISLAWIAPRAGTPSTDDQRSDRGGNLCRNVRVGGRAARGL